MIGYEILQLKGIKPANTGAYDKDDNVINRVFIERPFLASNFPLSEAMYNC